MALGALFGGASNARQQSKNLVEFRAGKMHMKGNMVHPDKRKGQVYVYQSDDSLMHFCWKDRTKGTIEDDLIIFPEDVEFKHVKQCTTGRVYLLKFKSSSRKMFFWLQEPKSDKDEENCRKVNEYLNHPPTPGSSRGGTTYGGMGSGLPADLAAGLGGDTDLQNILSNMSQQQLMQLLGGMGGIGGLSSLTGGRPSSVQSDSNPPSRVQSSPWTRTNSSTETSSQPPRPVTASALPSQTAPIPEERPSTQQPPASSGGGTDASNIQLSDLQSILSNMTVPPKENVDLAVAITPDAMIPILANPQIQQQLLPFLPEGESLPKTEEELRNTVKSPQFKQAMSSFSAALASGQLGPLMGQFGLGEEVANAAAQGDVEAFVKAMQAAMAKKDSGKGDEETKME
ncbi:Proteasomal ubiquitin receptor ADRM1 [Lamellibrachia satsuma]|nr:Proteasomal ubiquitin receptor ADRM1 [Lamellibrachia satsuma]